MSWTLDIPYRSLDDELIDVASAAGSLPDPEARAVLKELLVEVAGTGIKTAGDLFDRLARIEPADRRRLLDTMRERAGLESTADVEGHERFLAANRALLGRRLSLDEPPPDEQPRFSGGGGIMIPNKAAIERERGRDAQREAEFEQRQREKKAEYEAIRRAEERYVEDNIDDPIAFPPIAGFRQSQIRSA